MKKFFFLGILIFFALTGSAQNSDERSMRSNKNEEKVEVEKDSTVVTGARSGVTEQTKKTMQLPDAPTPEPTNSRSLVAPGPQKED